MIRQWFFVMIVFLAFGFAVACGGGAGSIASSKYHGVKAAGVPGYADGDTMPNFTLVSNSGAMVSLTDHKGKVILLQLAAMWCPVCQGDTPLLETEYYLPYRNRGPGFVVLQLLNSDDFDNTPSVSELETWASDYGLTFPALADDGTVFGAINPGYVPYYIVLDANLTVVATSDDGGNEYGLSYFDPFVRDLLGG
jgi:peroxiredoxin